MATRFFAVLGAGFHISGEDLETQKRQVGKLENQEKKRFSNESWLHFAFSCDILPLVILTNDWNTGGGKWELNDCSDAVFL